MVKVEKERLQLIMDIAKRARESDLLAFDTQALIMDLSCADRQFSLRLEEFLNADDFNFVHDIVGIQNNIDRRVVNDDGSVGKISRFVPRYAGS